jgi:hypothetical protein
MTLSRWGKPLVYQAENTKVKADYRQGNLVAKTQMPIPVIPKRAPSPVKSLMLGF